MRVKPSVHLPNLIAYALAGAIILFLLHGTHVRAFLRSFRDADMLVFVPASLIAFAIWFFGETFLFSRLFSFFFRPRTTFHELLPVNAAQYFLQTLNMLVASAALVLFLHRRRNAFWLEAAGAILFQSFIDTAVISLFTIAAALLVPDSPIRLGLPYAIGGGAFLLAVAAFWLWRKPRTRVERWLHEREMLTAFRLARPRHYLTLAAIRAAIFAGVGVMLYFQIIGFGIRVPLKMVLAYLPAVLSVGGLPLTPVGMGSMQAVLVYGFSAYAGRPELLAASLAISVIALLLRIPLGLGSAGAFVRETFAVHEERSRGAARHKPATAL